MMSVGSITTTTTLKRKRAAAKTESKQIRRKKNPEEFEHLRIFLLAQLRAQEYKFSSSEMDARACTERFDRVLRETSPDDYRKVKSEAVQNAMGKFFQTSAKGDRWVPWHTVLCDHEKYLHEKLYPLLRTQKERYVWMYIFSGSRLIPLFESIFLPILQGAMKGNKEQIELVRRLTNPESDIKSSLYCRNGWLHHHLLRYREDGKFKIHTSAYICRPPAGCSGLEYVFFINRRTYEFARLGNQVYNNVLANDKENNNNVVTMARLDEELQTLNGVGPTMSKMFTVSTHLMFPERDILENECTVGTGAKPAFDSLYPQGVNHSSGRKVSTKETPEDLLLDLLEILRTKQEYESVRVMIRFCSLRARDRFPGIPDAAISDHITAYDLQVNLCEWRKFRKILPTESQDLRSVLSEMVFLVTCMNTKTTVSLEKKRKTYRFTCTECKKVRQLPHCARYAWCGTCDTIPFRKRKIGKTTISRRDFDVWFDHERQAREDARIARRRVLCPGCRRYFSCRRSQEQHVLQGRCKKREMKQRVDEGGENSDNDDGDLNDLYENTTNVFSKCWVARDTSEPSPMFFAIMSNTPSSSPMLSVPVRTNSLMYNTKAMMSTVTIDDDDDDVDDDDDDADSTRYALRVPFNDMKLGEVAVEADVGLCPFGVGDDVLRWDAKKVVNRRC